MMKLFLFTFVVCCVGVAVDAPANATTTPAATAQYTAGVLVKGSGPEVYLITDEGTRRWIPDETTFVSMGYSWSAIATVNDLELEQYPLGDPLTDKDYQRPLPTRAEVEATVREYFADNPVMISIAQCESGFRQYNSDGTPLRGSNLYIGVFQIDEKIHAVWATQLGMDIYTLEGNLAYAKHLYERAGTRPWVGCAKNQQPLPGGGSLTSNLKMGDTNSQVKTLQQLLNSLDFPVATSGLGSPGNETEYFGLRTRAAVRSFQCAKNIVCEGSESTTGYGLVGPRTRGLLLQLASSR